ncbi:hypothetical protein R3P38DRAFT_3324955 [Favolaschia claudopus]|uniref:Uncharacterized protein n=1 Tax=Favolaschia claudopus TaxID=2862362 RepID=A0AAW0AEM5_9AGAR
MTIDARATREYLSPDRLAIFSVVFEAILYGFSLFMFAVTVYVLLRGRKLKKANTPFVVVACLLFVLSTIHISIDLDRLYLGFIVYRDRFPGGPEAWFADPHQALWVFKMSAYGMQTLLGDGVVVYRCYRVWNSVWAAVIPMLLWLYVLVTVVGTTYLSSQRSTTSISAGILGRWINAFLVATWTCNLTGTAILAFKLWQVERNIRRHRLTAGVTSSVLAVVLDAGALYSLALVVIIIFRIVKFYAGSAVVDILAPLISICFNLIFLRIGLQKEAERAGRYQSDQDSQTSAVSQVLPRISFARQGGGTGGGTDVSMEDGNSVVISRDRDSNEGDF